MARPKSADKRSAILTAATHIFAERGLSAPTSAISAEAGIAEGTLFTYFHTKDELLNALYREIKQQMAEEMLSEFPGQASVPDRFHYAWSQYIAWGIRHPLERNVLRQMEVWGGLTSESREAGFTPFAAIHGMLDTARKQQLLNEIPSELIGAAVGALAEASMELMQKNGQQADEYREAGFRLLWEGIARKV